MLYEVITDYKEKVKYGEDSPIYDGYSSNLSPGGISIATENGHPQPNSNIKIRIERAGGASIDVEEGKVLWVSNPPGVHTLMGIKFTGEDEEILKLYNTCCRYK